MIHGHLVVDVVLENTQVKVDSFDERPTESCHQKILHTGPLLQHKLPVKNRGKLVTTQLLAALTSFCTEDHKGTNDPKKRARRGI